MNHRQMSESNYLKHFMRLQQETLSVSSKKQKLDIQLHRSKQCKISYNESNSSEYDEQSSAEVDEPYSNMKQDKYKKSKHDKYKASHQNNKWNKKNHKHNKNKKSSKKSRRR